MKLGGCVWSSMRNDVYTCPCIWGAQANIDVNNNENCTNMYTYHCLLPTNSTPRHSPLTIELSHPKPPPTSWTGSSSSIGLVVYYTWHQGNGDITILNALCTWCQPCFQQCTTSTQGWQKRMSCRLAPSLLSFCQVGGDPFPDTHLYERDSHSHSTCIL